MNSLNELEKRKKKLKLQRDIAWMEREERALAFTTRAWRWALAVGLPAVLAIAGVAYFLASFTAHGAQAIWIRVGGTGLVLAAAGLRWITRRNTSVSEEHAQQRTEQ